MPGLYRRRSGAWVRLGAGTLPPPPPPPDPDPAPAGMTLLYQDQFTTLDPTRWAVYDNSTFGAPTRVQRYMAANVTAGPGSAGSTGGTSLKLVSKRENVGGNAFTAGMLDTKTVGRFYPRYGRFEFRCKTPHGQGLWPSVWLTAKNGGATTAELDVLEYFHSQIPGKNSTTLHRTDNSGTFRANAYTNNQNRTFFEAPTYTPAWHTWAAEIIPVTDATGATNASPTAPSSFVKYRILLDGVVVYQFVDTSALWYTTNGGAADSFWQIYIQGCQIDGTYVGAPDDELGYSHWLGQCLIGGTPGSCVATRNGYSVQRAQFADPASTLELDYLRVYTFTG